MKKLIIPVIAVVAALVTGASYNVPKSTADAKGSNIVTVEQPSAIPSSQVTPQPVTNSPESPQTPSVAVTPLPGTDEPQVSTDPTPAPTASPEPTPVASPVPVQQFAPVTKYGTTVSLGN